MELSYYLYNSKNAKGIEVITDPDSLRGTNMGPIWGRQDPDGPHVDPMNFAIWGG